jgi:hypothetical protein
VEGERGIIGVMLESFLVAGRQDFADRAALTPGQSITDACLGWDTTVPVLPTSSNYKRGHQLNRCHLPSSCAVEGLPRRNKRRSSFRS